MPTFSGALITSPGGVYPAGAPVFPPVHEAVGISATSQSLGTGAHAPGVTSHVSASFAGVVSPWFGGRLFERIVILPSFRNLGFVLSNTQLPIEIWNTYHDAAKTLTARPITGFGGIVLTDPFGLPVTINPKDSRVYQALMPSSGPSGIDQIISFVVTGETTVSTEIIGNRILVFSVAPDWDYGIKEKISYLTDVLVAYSDKEQRRGIRRLPRRGIKFRPMTLNARDAAGMESLVWGWQHQPYGVPFWQDQTFLTADIPIGSNVIPIVTTNRMFAVGGMVLLWRSEFDYEAQTIIAMDGVSLTTQAPVVTAWDADAGSLIVPVVLARLSPSVEVNRLFSGADQMEVEFIGEALQAATDPDGTFTQYRGYDVLEVAPNWVNELRRQYTRSTIAMDPGPGPITVDDKGGSPVVSHDVPWWADSHDKAAQIRAFLAERMGQLQPFWCLTWDQDLTMAANLPPGGSVLSIQSVFYSRFFFPNPARRDLAFVPMGPGPILYRRVTAAVDNFDGTESLTLDSPVTAGIVNGSTMICFLAFSRLGSDDTEIDWMTTDLANADVSIQELPRETP